jgi:hemin uptake protein HemP
MGDAAGKVRVALGNLMGETVVNFATKRTAVPSLPAAPAQKPRIESDHLFQGNNEIVIVHQKEEYNLRITRNGKLILTK